jgi:hypothetical protein
MAFSFVSFSAISAMSSTEGEGLCSVVETVLGELHVLEFLTWYFQMTRQNTY